MKKFFLCSFVIIITLLLTVVGLLYADIWDIDPPDVSDLEIKYVAVPPEDNAFTYLKQASEIYYEPEPGEGVSEDEFYNYFYEVVEGRKSDSELFDDYMAKNQKTLSLITQALNCSSYQSKELLPSGKTIDFENAFSVSEAMAVSRLLEHSFFYQLDKKLYEQAFESITNRLQLGMLMLNMKNPSYIDSLAATAILMGTTRKFVENIKHFSNDSILNFPKRFVGKGAIDKVFVEAGRFEYCLSAYYTDCISEIVEEGRADESEEYMIDALPFQAERFGWFFQPNRTKKQFYEFYKMFNSLLCKENYKKSSLALEKFVSKRKISPEILLSEWGENAIGKVLNYALQGSGQGILENKFELQSHIEATRTAIACELYRRKYGELPESLNTLVPDFLESVPSDPFDGKPLRYDKQKKIIYSVGENLIDSGGIGEREIKKMKSGTEKRKARDVKDLVFYLTPKESK